MKCPKCGYKISSKKLAAEIGGVRVGVFHLRRSVRQPLTGKPENARVEFRWSSEGKHHDKKPT